MKDNLSIVITMLLLVILIIIFPLYNYFERQDNMSYNVVLKATTIFTDEVLNAGYLNQDMYNNFVKQLANTGNYYDIQLEAHKKVLVKSLETGLEDKYTEEYLIDYNKDIFDESTGDANTSAVDERVLKEKSYLLKPGDQFYVKLKNTNTTMAGSVFNTIVPTSTTERIAVNYGGIVKNNAWAKVDSTYLGHGSNLNGPIVVATPDIIKNGPASSSQEITFTASANSSDWWKSVKKYVWKIIHTDGSIKTYETNAVNNIARLSGIKMKPVSGVCKIEVYGINSEEEKSSVTNVSFQVRTLKPNKPNVTSNPADLTNIKIGRNISFSATSNANNPGASIKEYKWIITAPGASGSVTTNYYTQKNINLVCQYPGNYTIQVYAVDTFNVSSDIKTINFNVNSKFVVNARTDGNGYATGSGTYSQNDVANISCSPNPGYSFVRWQSSDGRYKYYDSFSWTVKENITWTAIFQKSSYQAIDVSHVEIDFYYKTITGSESNTSYTLAGNSSSVFSNRINTEIMIFANIYIVTTDGKRENYYSRDTFDFNFSINTTSFCSGTGYVWYMSRRAYIFDVNILPNNINSYTKNVFANNNASMTICQSVNLSQGGSGTVTMRYNSATVGNRNVPIRIINNI